MVYYNISNIIWINSHTWRNYSYSTLLTYYEFFQSLFKWITSSFLCFPFLQQLFILQQMLIINFNFDRVANINIKVHLLVWIIYISGSLY